jgi:hypothetical protein
VTGPSDIPVGRVAVVADPFGNALVVLDLSKGRYVTDTTRNVTGIALADDTAAPATRGGGGQSEQTGRRSAPLR